MILRKNISLNEEYIKKLEPLLQIHNDNLSAVIREVIDLADAAFHDPDSVKRLISGLNKEQSLTSSTLVWALKNLAGILPDEETVHNIIGNNISSISSLEKRLSELGSEIYWGLSVKISSEDDKQPEKATFTITGKNPYFNRFFAAIIAVFSAKEYNLSISEIRVLNDIFEIKMERREKERALKSIHDNFGYMDAAFSELHKKPDFWSTVINFYVKMDYDLVILPRQFFEEILCGKENLKITSSIERFCSSPINRIPLEELLEKMKVLYQYTGLIKHMDINKKSLIIHHGLTEHEAIKKLADIFVALLNLNGHTYSSMISENLIVLKQESEVGKILIRMVEDIKTQKIPFENYHKDFLEMLEMLKNVPSDEGFIKSLGNKFGKKMIQNYENNKNIKEWDTNTFFRYLQETSMILGQDSKCSIVSENVIHCKILSCPVARSNEVINVTNCTFIKGIFNGWLSHAFGEQLKRIHKTYTEATGKNGFCEIYVAFLTAVEKSSVNNHPPEKARCN